jgi:hypothetical protein
MKYIGIDPGKSGGIAIIEDEKLTLFSFPKIGKELDFIAIKNFLKENCKSSHIVGLENVKALQRVGSTQSFNFGVNKGQLEGILIGIECSYLQVLPQTWQKVCWEGVPKQDNTKNTSLIASKRLFPKESFLASERSKVPHDGLIDAALIAKYLEIKYRK